MPLKGIQEVFGVLTLSRRASDIPFTQEDADVLTPLLSNAAFTYDNLNLMKRDRKNRQQLATVTGICKTLGSSLRNSELLHAVLNQFREDVPFDIAVIMEIRKDIPDQAGVLDILSSIPLGLDRNGGYDFTGSSWKASSGRETSWPSTSPLPCSIRSNRNFSSNRGSTTPFSCR